VKRHTFYVDKLTIDAIYLFLFQIDENKAKYIENLRKGNMSEILINEYLNLICFCHYPPAATHLILKLSVNNLIVKVPVF
jgi:hypothetical protein